MQKYFLAMSTKFFSFQQHFVCQGNTMTHSEDRAHWIKEGAIGLGGRYALNYI